MACPIFHRAATKMSLMGYAGITYETHANRLHYSTFTNRLHSDIYQISKHILHQFLSPILAFCGYKSLYTPLGTPFQALRLQLTQDSNLARSEQNNLAPFLVELDFLVRLNYRYRRNWINCRTGGGYRMRPMFVMTGFCIIRMFVQCSLLLFSCSQFYLIWLIQVLFPYRRCCWTTLHCENDRLGAPDRT